jgi:arylsulfatase A-like enzyme
MRPARRRSTEADLRAFSIEGGLSMDRRQVLATIAGAATAPAVLQGQKRPNVLWILGEDMGPWLSCYGHPLVRTPNIDRLANEGTRFTRMFTTAPVCSAARSAWNTGMYQTRIGAHNHRSHRQDGYQLPQGVQLISERFRQAGYFTANVRQIAPGVQGSGKTDFNFTAPKPFDGTHWNERKQGQPFYAQINFSAPHKGPAFVAARKQKVLIDPSKVELPPYHPDHPVIRDEYANFMDAIQLLDSQIGVTLQALEKDGELENTIICFFGDNGRCLLRGKQWLYDAGTHVPFVVRYPGVVPKGAVRNDLAVSLDITAQTLEWAGLPTAGLDGQPLFGPKHKDREYVFTARDRCDMTVDRIRAVRSKRYKLIRNFMPERPYTQWNQYIEQQYPTLGVLQQLHKEGKLNAVQSQFMAARRPELEFYDLEQDPHEINNLAASSKHQKLLKDHQAKMDAWIRDTKDQGAIPEPREVIEREDPRAKKAK